MGRLDDLVDLLARRGWPGARPWFLALPLVSTLPELLKSAVERWMHRFEERLEEEPAIRLDPAFVRYDFVADDYRAACEAWLRDATAIPEPFRDEAPFTRALREEVEVFMAALDGAPQQELALTEKPSGAEDSPEVAPPVVEPQELALVEEPVPSLEEAPIFDMFVAPVQGIEEALDQEGEVRLRLDRERRLLDVDGSRIDLSNAPARWEELVRLWDRRSAAPGEGWLATSDWKRAGLRKFEELLGDHADAFWERAHGRVRLLHAPRPRA